MKCPGLTENEYTFFVTEGSEEAQKFFNIIRLIDQVSPLGPPLMEDIEMVVVKGKSFAQIRTSSRMISQSVRTNSGFFSTLPPEINVKIAGLTGNPNAHSKEQSANIAINHFCKPPTK